VGSQIEETGWRHFFGRRPDVFRPVMDKGHDPLTQLFHVFWMRIFTCENGSFLAWSECKFHRYGKDLQMCFRKKRSLFESWTNKILAKKGTNSTYAIFQWKKYYKEASFPNTFTVKIRICERKYFNGCLSFFSFLTIYTSYFGNVPHGWFSCRFHH